MNLGICRICKQPGADVLGDYCTVTGRTKLPGLNSRNFDDRYGLPCHKGCLEKRTAKLERKKQ